MSSNEKTRFIYLHSLNEKIPVSEDEYQKFSKEATRIRKYEQYHHRCFCPKQFNWKCDGDCDICEYHSTGVLSLDAGNCEDGSSLYDSDLIATSCMENVIEDRMLLNQLFQRLRELDPDADRIIEMWMDDDKVSDRKIAEALGRPQRTFSDQMKRYRAEFRKIRGY